MVVQISSKYILLVKQVTGIRIYKHIRREMDGSMDRQTENRDIDRTRQDGARQDQTRLKDKTRTDQNRPHQTDRETGRQTDRFRQTDADNIYIHS